MGVISPAVDGNARCWWPQLGHNFTLAGVAPAALKAKVKFWNNWGRQAFPRWPSKLFLFIYSINQNA